MVKLATNLKKKIIDFVCRKKTSIKISKVLIQDTVFNKVTITSSRLFIPYKPKDGQCINLKKIVSGKNSTEFINQGDYFCFFEKRNIRYESSIEFFCKIAETDKQCSM